MLTVRFLEDAQASRMKAADVTRELTLEQAVAERDLRRREYGSGFLP